MQPTESAGRVLNLPVTERHGIVIVTGDAPRHRRFALRIQEEFGELVDAWFEIRSPSAAPASKSLRSKLGKIKRSITSREPEPNAEEEARVFRSDLDRLSRIKQLTPQILEPSDIGKPEFLAKMAELRPYFFLTLGGALHPKAVLELVQGVAINQHAGHSPEYKGTCTTEWALYHRQLAYVSNTVHITATGADNGPILRRSHPCLTAADSFEAIFARVVATGTEMLIECVRDIIRDGSIRVFDQDQRIGRTYLGSDLKPDVVQAIRSDLAGGLVGRELARLREF